jgi:hypothetical protein
MMADKIVGFANAGNVGHRGLNLPAPDIPHHRQRHQYGLGPFARLVMPALPDAPGVYLWQEDNEIVYVGQTRTPLKKRLGPNGYSAISAYNTLARETNRRNGGQQTNCRVNALANKSLAARHALSIWYRITSALGAADLERDWMTSFGMPKWNRNLRQASGMLRPATRRGRVDSG